MIANSKKIQSKKSKKMNIHYFSSPINIEKDSETSNNSKNYLTYYDNKKKEFSIIVKNYEQREFDFLSKIIEENKWKIYWEPSQEEVEKFKNIDWERLTPHHIWFLEKVDGINLKKIEDSLKDEDLESLCFLCKNIKFIKARSSNISEKGLFWLSHLNQIRKISLIHSSIQNFNCSSVWKNLESINLSGSMSLIQFSGSENISQLKKIKLENCRLIENIFSIFHFKLQTLQIDEIGALEEENFIDLLTKIKIEEMSTEINLNRLESIPLDKKHSILKNFLLISDAIEDLALEREAYLCFKDFALHENSQTLQLFLEKHPEILQNIKNQLKKPLYPEWILLARNLNIDFEKNLNLKKMRKNIISFENLVSLFEVANTIKNEELLDECLYFLSEKSLIDFKQKENSILFLTTKKSKIENLIFKSIIDSFEEKNVFMSYSLDSKDSLETIPVFLKKMKNQLTELHFMESLEENDMKNVDALLSFFPNIKKLSLPNTIFLELSSDSIESLKGLEQLKIIPEKSGLLPDENDVFLEAEKKYFLEKMENLKKLDLSSIDQIVTIDLTHCPSLEKIILMNNKNLSVVKGLSSLTKLTTLVIEGENKISVSTLLDIIEDLALSNHQKKDSLHLEMESVLARLIRHTLVIENEYLEKVDLLLIFELYNFFKEKEDILSLKAILEDFFLRKNNEKIINLLNSEKKIKEKLFNRILFICRFYPIIDSSFLQGVDFSELFINEPLEILDHFFMYDKISLHMLEFFKSTKGREILLKELKNIWRLAPTIKNLIWELYPCTDKKNVDFYPVFIRQNEKKLEIYCLRSALKEDAMEILDVLAFRLSLLEEIEDIRVFYYGEKGVDARGLSRDFMRNIFVAVSEKLKLQEGIPPWNESSDSIFSNIGTVLGFLTQPQHRNKYPLGSIFSSDFFKGLTLFSNQQLREPFENMSEQEILDISVHLSLLNKNLKNCADFLDWNGTIINEEQRLKSLKNLEILQSLSLHLSVETPFTIEDVDSEFFAEKTRFFCKAVVDKYLDGEPIDLKLKKDSFFMKSTGFKSSAERKKKQEIQEQMDEIQQPNAFLGIGPRYREGKKQMALIHSLIDDSFTSEVSLPLITLEKFKLEIKEQILEYRRLQCKTMYKILRALDGKEEETHGFFNASWDHLKVLIEGKFSLNDLLESLHFSPSIPLWMQNLIREWIKNRSEDELKIFLTYVYGSPAIPCQGIKIFLQESQPIALIAHTCFGHLDIFSEIKEEGLIHALDSVIKDKHAGQFQVA